MSATLPPQVSDTAAGTLVETRCTIGLSAGEMHTERGTAGKAVDANVLPATAGA